MIKKSFSNQSCGRDRECKMVRFKVPQYIKLTKSMKNLNWPNLNSDNKAIRYSG